MKSLTLLIAVVYFHGSLAWFENLNFQLPKGFDITNVRSFKGFDATGLDGKIFNPFSYDKNDIFKRYREKYSKDYAEEEIPERKENLFKAIESIAKKIVEHFVEGKNPTFTIGLNGLSDRSDAEYRQLLGTRTQTDRTVEVSDRRKRSTSNDAVCKPKSNSTLPTSWDWRSKNIVTPVKSQNTNCRKVITRQYQSGNQIITEYSYQCDSCGCCWAFASSATIESQWALKTNQMIDLSEQDLVNCASADGCNGDSIDTAYNYVMTNGEAQEASEPYTAKVGQCRHYPLVNGVQISDYCRKGGTTNYRQSFSNGTVKQWSVTEDNPDSKIMRDIYEVGPIVALINADDLSARLYTSGVYDLQNCSNSTNHAITLVGWGTDSNGVNYWIAKNSWNTTWGEQGYFRIVRGKNMCGINQMYYYPILTNTTPYNKAS